MAALNDRPSPESATVTGTKDINWEKLDKTKFFGVGTGLFTGVTLMLYPLSVIKTQMQLSSVNAILPNPNLSSTAISSTLSSTARSIYVRDGVKGFYRGLGTVLTATIPARCLYLSTLELTKSATVNNLSHNGWSLSSQAFIGSGVGGLFASLASQMVIVPMDVVSSRLMAQGMTQNGSSSSSIHGRTEYKGGIDAVRTIIQREGLRGLYRGFPISILTYLPSSATWWSTYGASQHFLWKLEAWLNRESSEKGPPHGALVVAIQAVGGTCAGTVAAIVTTPLDTVKTRIQVLKNEVGGSLSVGQVVKQLIREEGVGGFYRGFVPRWASMALWGTCMVTTYEFLKRLAVKSDL